MRLLNPNLILLFVFFSVRVHAQSVTGEIRFKTSGINLPDSGAHIYLCHRAPDMHADDGKIRLKEIVQREYDLSLEGTTRNRAKHKKVLSRQYGVKDSADMGKYFIEAAKEENTIITANDVQVRIADGAGRYSFNNIPAGSYWVLIRSGNTRRSDHCAIHVAQSEIVINRILGEYSMEAYFERWPVR